MTIRLPVPALCHVLGSHQSYLATDHALRHHVGRRQAYLCADRPEPNYRWKEYCSQSLAIADELMSIDHYVRFDVLRLPAYPSVAHRRQRRRLSNAKETGRITARWAFLLFWM